MNLPTVEDLAESWITESQKKTGDLILYDECHEDPERAWLAILHILKKEITTDQKALLAAGPLEDLLSLHGPQFIERVELEARDNSRFNDLLGGVWRLNMTEDVWQRVQNVRNKVW